MRSMTKQGGSGPPPVLNAITWTIRSCRRAKWVLASRLQHKAAKSGLLGGIQEKPLLPGVGGDDILSWIVRYCYAGRDPSLCQKFQRNTATWIGGDSTRNSRPKR